MSNNTLCPWPPSRAGLGLSALRMSSWPGSTLDGTAYHGLARSCLAVPCQGTHAAHPDDAPQVHTDTSAPAGLLSWAQGQSSSPRAGTVSLTHPRAASTLCMAVAGDKPCSALPGGHLLLKQPDTCLQGKHQRGWAF